MCRSESWHRQQKLGGQLFVMFGCLALTDQLRKYSCRAIESALCSGSWSQLQNSHWDLQLVWAGRDRSTSHCKLCKWQSFPPTLVLFLTLQWRYQAVVWVLCYWFDSACGSNSSRYIEQYPYSIRRAYPPSTQHSLPFIDQSAPRLLATLLWAVLGKQWLPQCLSLNVT